MIPHPPSSNTRLYHLDALRSAAILYGLFVHTATLGVHWPITLVSVVSGYFRMGTFFLVSGFFAAMVLSRTTSKIFLQRRALALVVPFLCGVAILNPVTNWLIWNWHNPPLPFSDFLRRAWNGTLPVGRGPMIWHLHLWFLVSLMFYAVMTPAVVALSRRIANALIRIADRLTALPGWLCVIAVASLCAVSTLAMRTFFEIGLERFLSADTWNVSWLVRTTLNYWPMFLTGMAVFHHRALGDRFQTVSLPALAIGIAAVVIINETVFPKAGLRWEVLQLLSRSFLTVSVIAALMALFKRWFSEPGFLSRSADAVYSIYILHFLVIYVIAFGLRPLNLTWFPLYWSVVVLATIATFMIHRFLVRPSSVLSLLFNGKPLSTRRAARSMVADSAVQQGRPFLSHQSPQSD